MSIEQSRDFRLQDSSRASPRQAPGMGGTPISRREAMRRGLFGAAGLLLANRLGSPATAKAAVAPNVKSGLPDKAIPQGLGFNVHIMGPDKDWDEIKAAGGKLIRADFTWEGIERTKGEYDFRRHDKMLDSLDARGIRAILILCYNNPLYPPATITDEGREAYAKWAAASVKHYNGRGVFWEIWNEPNVGFWREGKGGLNSTQFADQYVELVKKAVPAMRATDPDCYIMGGSVSCLWKDSFRWVEEAFKQGLLTSGINALSVHPYGFARPELAISKNEPGAVDVNGYGYLRDLMAKYNAPKDFPVVNTESGYETNRNRSLEQQAMLAVRWYLVDQMCNIRTSIWYNWDENDAETMRVRSNGPEPLPIYKAIKNMTGELTGYHFVERMKEGSGVDYVLALENGAKARKIVAWTVPQARDDSQDKAKAHELAISTAGSKGPVAVRDLYGKPVEAKAEGDSVTVTLTASPVYIDCTGKSKAAVTSGPPSLKVVGNRLKTLDGAVVRLQGVNIASLEWTAQGENVLRSVRVAIDDWGANIIRLPLAQDRWFGKAKEQKDGGEAYRKLVKEVVDAVEAKKCYVILDLHWSNAGVWGQHIAQHRMPDDNSLSFWEAVALIYANHQAVLFGLYNEPFEVSWKIWRDGGTVVENSDRGKLEYHTPGMQKLLDAIRGKGAKNVIVAGGLDWAYDLSGIVKGFALSDAKGNGIVYDTHIYPWKKNWDQYVTVVLEKHAVLVGECGCAADGKNEDPKTWAPKMLDYIEKHQLNWTAWDFHPGAGPPLIKDWSYAPTREWGVPVRKALQLAAKGRVAAAKEKR